MGRPWEYPRWRRVLMQVVMWLVFAGSLCLARALSHEHGINRGNLFRAGPFEVPVPDEFTVDASGPDKNLLAHDRQRGRRLRVRSMSFSSAESWMSSRSDEARKIQFRHLRTIGVLETLKGLSQSDEGDAILYRVRATAPVPGIQRLVVITLDVGSDFNNTDEEVVEDIAMGISLAKDVPPTPSMKPPGNDPG